MRTNRPSSHDTDATGATDEIGGTAGRTAGSLSVLVGWIMVVVVVVIMVVIVIALVRWGWMVIVAVVMGTSAQG